MRLTIFRERAYDGTLVLSCVDGDGHRVQRRYQGYSLREAMRMFREEIKNGGK